MRRLIATLSAVALATFMLWTPVAANDGVPGWDWDESYNGWIDLDCGTPAQLFKVDLYESQDYGGRRTRACHNLNNFCNVPMYAPYAVPSCDWPNQSFNDRASSVKVLIGTCATFYLNSGYGGTSYVVIGNYPHLDDMGWGNRFSSMVGC